MSYPNVARPRGFRPKGAAVRENRYQANTSTPIYPGDAVTLTAAGTVASATAGQALVGVSNSYYSGVLPSGQTSVDVMVWDDPDQLFYVNASGAVPELQTDFNTNYNILATAGSTQFKVSRQQLDSTSASTTATLQLKLLDFDPRPNDNLASGNPNVDCIVAINNHQLKGGTGTVGV
jgi:hypothetical protein